jgi:hypothetical protein
MPPPPSDDQIFAHLFQALFADTAMATIVNALECAVPLARQQNLLGSRWPDSGTNCNSSDVAAFGLIG